MLGIEIAMLIIGFGCVCVSFFVARRKSTPQAGDDVQQTTGLWSEKEEEIIRERVTELLEAKQFEIVDEAEERMNHLCNDKIMAIDEFSKPLLEKIENNHQEVVFMYNLLNEKEKEVKTTVLEPVKRVSEEIEKPEVVKENQLEKTRPSVPKKKVVEKPKSGIDTVKKQKTGESAPKKKMAKKEKDEIKVPGNVNLQIQKMHKEGKSVLDISKELNIGQGEVSLVLALYGGKKS